MDITLWSKYSQGILCINMLGFPSWKEKVKKGGGEIMKELSCNNLWFAMLCPPNGSPVKFTSHVPTVINRLVFKCRRQMSFCTYCIADLSLSLRCWDLVAKCSDTTWKRVSPLTFRLKEINMLYKYVSSSFAKLKIRNLNYINGPVVKRAKLYMLICNKPYHVLERVLESVSCKMFDLCLLLVIFI